MCRKILVQASRNLAYAVLDVAVHGSNDRSHSFSVYRFIVRVVAAPKGGPCLGVAQLELKGHTDRQSVSVDLPEVIQASAEKIVPANVAAQGIDVLVAPRRLKLSQQDIANHVRWRLGPSMIFVRAHRLTIGCVDDAVVSIQMRGRDPAEQQSYGIGGRICSRRRVAGNGELIILAWPGGAAAIQHSKTYYERRKYRSEFHCCSPALCSRGLLARMRV